VNSVSGSIQVDILPEEEDSDAPAPAELYLHTVSGSISGYLPFGTHYPSHEKKPSIPEREYRTHVESKSGRLQGRFMLGSNASFKSLSGSINLEMLNAHNKIPKNTDNHAIFSTETYSGSTQVDVITDGTKNKDPIHNLSSTHSGKSGSMKLVYPSEWEGIINAKSLSGSLKVAGEGVVIDRDGSRDYVNKEITAHKGTADMGRQWSQIAVDEISGSVDILIGGKV